MSLFDKVSDFAQDQMSKQQGGGGGGGGLGGLMGGQSGGASSGIGGMLQKLVSSHDEGGAGQGTDWSNLTSLANHFAGSQASGNGGNPADLADRAAGGSPEAPAADTNVINKLLAAYQQHSGSSFSGGSSEFDQLAQFATEKTGTSIPKPLLEKMVMWKVNQMI